MDTSAKGGDDGSCLGKCHERDGDSERESGAELHDDGGLRKEEVGG
jgi:hypothetical protein